jgi:phosphoribosylformimino-5-aminoimidazole carboxamide ribotide isomerase
MILLPAIDLMNGEVVRLKQGRASEKTVYSSDPVAFAKRWEAEGGDFLHIVDLDAAFTGEQRNLDVVREIASAISIPCELGGGMRDEAAIARALGAGVARVVIGTRAAESLQFVEQMAAKHGPDKIAVGIDAKHGVVSVKGWTESAGLSARQLALDAQSAGAGTIIYTDIATDGMLQGPNLPEIKALLGMLRCQLVASGGVSALADIDHLAELPTLYGVIMGRALYENTLNLRDAARFKAPRA